MTIHIALLRGINVGGHKQVAMADLRGLLTRLGFVDARSLLQSGNLVFRSRARTGAQLERFLEAETEKHLGLQADFFVRTVAEWDQVLVGNPFPKEAGRDPGHLLVMFLKDAPGVKDVKALQAAIRGPEVFRAKSRHAYIIFPNGTGRSRLTGALIEKTLGTRATGRNWNTVRKLGALANL
ncbi:MAG: DUF1697 domain-containing protein [Acidobacteria bacterium]|nr:DUF1697 domain-containing protein [Acidobacteriota bacterium]MBI3656314.1 DUF1697 domain-containing protein [Acidobacteriota bacterium]